MKGLLGIASQKFLGGVPLDPAIVDRIGGAAGTVLKDAITAFTQVLSGGTGRGKVKDAVLESAAKAFSEAFLQDRAATAAGEPPKVDKDEELLRYLRPDGNYVAPGVEPGTFRLGGNAKNGHFLYKLLERLGVQSGSFGGGVAEQIKASQRDLYDLGDTANWLTLAKRVAVGILEDQNLPAIAKLVNLVPTEAIGGKKRRERAEPEPGPVPQAPMSDSTSSTARREFADTNAIATYMFNRAFNGRSEKAEQKTVEDLVRKALGGLNVPEDHRLSDAKIATITSELGKALKGLTGTQKMDHFRALAAIFQGLAVRAEREASKAPLLEKEVAKLRTDDPKGQLKKREEELRRANEAADRAVTYRNFYQISHNLGLAVDEMGVNLDDLARGERTSGFIARLDQFLGFAVSTFVADAAGIPISGSEMRKNRLAYESLAYALFQGDALRTAEKRRVQAAQRDLGRASDVFVPLLSGIDPKDAAGSARKIAAMFLKGAPAEQAKAAEPRLVAALEAVLAKGCTDNQELAKSALTWLQEHTGLEATKFQFLYEGIAASEAKLRAAASAVLESERLLKETFARAQGNKEDIQSTRKELDALRKQEPTDEKDKKVRDQAIAKALEKLKRQEGDAAKISEARAKIEDEIQGYRDEQKQAEDQTHRIAGQTLQFVGLALLEPDRFKAKLDEIQKAAAQESDRRDAPPKGPGDPPKGPPPPDGNGFASNPVPGGMTLARRRAYECSLVLNDPSLSVQDKVFMFMMIYAAYSDLEREDKLRELTQLDERQASWDEKRSKLQKIRDESLNQVQRNTSRVETANERVKELEGKPGSERDLEAARRELAEAQKALTTANEESIRASNEYLSAEKEYAAPKNREVIMMEIDRLTKFREQIMQMARSIIDDANRLIERIFR